MAEAFAYQYEAGVIAATDWKEALKKANIDHFASQYQTPESAEEPQLPQIFPAWKAEDFKDKPDRIEYLKPSDKK